MPGSIDYVSLLTELGSVTFTDLRPAQVAALERYAAEYSAATDLPSSCRPAQAGGADHGT